MSCLQNSNLRQQLTKGRDAAFKEVQLRNKFLTDKLELLEQQLQQKVAVRASQVCGLLTHLTLEKFD